MGQTPFPCDPSRADSPNPRDTGYPHGSSWYWNDDPYGAREIDCAEALKPLVRVLKSYDAARLRLQEHGGRLSDLARIARLLASEIALRGRYGQRKPSLTDPEGLRAALREIDPYSLHLQVRRLPTGMPVYYLCRTRREYLAQYSLIVEDLYRSPGYPMADERFAKLMYDGHERYYLRLSPFRDAIRTAEPHDPCRHVVGRVDEALYRLGRHVFQAAWHEDQRPALAAAKHFRMTRLRHAIELLYLVLSGELCELRTQIDGPMLGFFASTYPQPALHSFLVLLKELDGGAIHELPRRALAEYAGLSAAFGRFLRVEVEWGSRRKTLPLYKLLFGNFSRLGAVRDALQNSKVLPHAIARVEALADGIVRQLTDAEAATSGTSIARHESWKMGGEA